MPDDPTPTSPPAPVLIIDTGVANIASVRAGWRRLGRHADLTTDPAAVRHAPLIVLPGVGAFAAGIDRLDRLGLREPLLDRARAGLPLLAICLGLQLLFDSSDESPGVRGLGILHGHVGTFADPLLRPQLGWNRVTPRPRTPGTPQAPFQAGDAYFANSHRVDAAAIDHNPGFGFAVADYGPESFIAALWRGRLLACQFHPELSGPWGLSVLSAWIRASGAGEGAAA